MSDILVINDDTADMGQVTAYAYNIAAKLGRNIIMADTIKAEKAFTVEEYPEHPGKSGNWSADKDGPEDLLMFTLSHSTYFKPQVNIIDASSSDEYDLAKYTYVNNIFMIVQGISSIRSKKCPFNPGLLLNKICCPLLLIPEFYSIKPVDRIAYLTDMRYSQTSILTYLDRLSEKSVLLAHNCYEGLPDLTDNYANDLFKGAVVPKVRSGKLFFGHIRETDIGKIADTLSSGVNINLLACVNRQFHFNRILGERFPAFLPDFLSIPLLVFPS